MNDAIDSALAKFIGFKKNDLDSIDMDTLTIAERIAISMILESLEKGGNATKLVVERVGGTAVSKNINLNGNMSAKSDDLVGRLATLLGGSRDELVSEREARIAAVGDADASDEGDVSEAAILGIEDGEDDGDNNDNGDANVFDGVIDPANIRTMRGIR